MSFCSQRLRREFKGAPRAESLDTPQREIGSFFIAVWRDSESIVSLTFPSSPARVTRATHRTNSISFRPCPRRLITYHFQAAQKPRKTFFSVAFLCDSHVHCGCGSLHASISLSAAAMENNYREKNENENYSKAGYT
jgi:hypothetical protein